MSCLHKETESIRTVNNQGNEMINDNARKFIVSELLELPLIQERAGRRLDAKKAKDIFAKHPKYTKAKGCYVFGLRAARGYKPIYVGKTTDQTLGRESLSDGTVRKINMALLKTRKATLVVAFVIPETQPGACPQKAIGEIESVLIQYAYQKNPQIENENGICRCGWYIDGVLNRGQGKPPAHSREFRRLVGIAQQSGAVLHAAVKAQPRKNRQAIGKLRKGTRGKK